MRKDLAIVVSNDNKNVTINETIEAIDKAGFKNVFVQWYDNDLQISQEEQVKICKSKGLNILFAHLGYQNINSIWTNDGEYFVERYKKNVSDCKRLGIDMVVMHTCAKWEAPEPNIIGLNRFKEIIEYAKSLDVKVALENTKLKGYIEYIFDNADYDNLGICFDAGHFHCNQKDDWNIERYKNKVYCVHLHDNDGNEDQHLLPFDGNVDWNNIFNKLKSVNYDGPITMELHYHRDYVNMNVDDFYSEAYKRGLKISDLYQEIIK